MTPEQLKHSLRRFNRRTASLRRRMVAAILHRSRRSEKAYPVYRRGIIRGFVQEPVPVRRRTRQELRHIADWQQSQEDIGLS